MTVQEAKALRDLAWAAHRELVFNYSHPMTAERGEVWTERSKVSRLYKALKDWRRAIR